MVVLWEKTIWWYQNIVFILYFSILLPIFDFVFEYTKTNILQKDFLNDKLKILENFKEKKDYVFLFLILLNLGIYWDNLLKFWTISFLLASLFYKIKSKLSYIIALFIIFFVPILLLLKLNVSAETATIYSSYFLIIWIVVWFFENKDFSNLWNYNLVKKWNIALKSIISSIKNDYENIFYDLVLLFFILLVWAFYVNFFSVILIKIFFFIIFIYIFFKFLWFKIDYKKFNQNFDVSYYIITSSLLWLMLIPILKNSIVNHKLYALILWLAWYAFLYFIFSNNTYNFTKNIIKKHSFIKVWINIMIWFMFFGLMYKNIDYYLHYTKKPHHKKVVQTLTKEEKILTNQKFKPDTFTDNLYPWAEWKTVALLQEFLDSEWFYDYEISWKYDEKTRLWMNQFLTKACKWEKTNLWILWPQARQCISDYLKLKRPE